jgi:uncharacterized protein
VTISIPETLSVSGGVWGFPATENSVFLCFLMSPFDKNRRSNHQKNICFLNVLKADRRNGIKKKGKSKVSSFIDYARYIQDALLKMIRKILEKVEKEGLQGNHAFYITFKTNGDGVKVPDFLKAAYPDEVTIVLQHQFENLHVSENYFQVDLSFSGVYYPLTVPFDSVLSFSDPSEQVIFQFYDLAAEKDKRSEEESLSVDILDDEDKKDMLSKEEKRELFNLEGKKVQREKATSFPAQHETAELIDFDTLKKKKKKS